MQDSTGDNQNYLMGVAGGGFEVDWSSGEEVGWGTGYVSAGDFFASIGW